MHLTKSNSACSWARRMRRFLLTSEKSVVSCRECHSSSDNSAEPVLQERSFKSMFMRPPPTRLTARKLSTSSPSPKPSPFKRQLERKGNGKQPYPSVPISRMKQLNPFVLNSNAHDLRRFLEQVGTDPKEARYWLQQFKQSSDFDTPFAVVQVDTDVIDCPDMLENLASSLSFLQRNGMKCVVVHGCSLPTNPEDLPIDLQVVRTQLSADSMMLASTLEAHGTHARPFFSGNGIVQATENTQGDNMGSSSSSSSSNIGSVYDVNVDAVQWALASGHIPVLQSVGETVEDGAGGRIVVLDVGEVTARLAAALQPRKVLFINTYGGFVGTEGETIPNVNLPTHWDHAPTDEEWSDDVRSRVHFIGNLLSSLPEQSSVVITSATSLLTELFTHHGSGTFFRITEPILMYKSLKSVDLERLAALLCRSFGKDLTDEYFLELQDRIHTLYLSKDYSAAAIVVQDAEDFPPYLDKFAVSQAKQGEGTGEMLWECIRRDFPRLFWRSRTNNDRINPWYFKHCEGTWNHGQEWTVFWYGIQDHQETSSLIRHAVHIPASFKGPERSVAGTKGGKN